MNRRGFLGLVAAIPTFSVLLPRETRALDFPRPTLQLTLLDYNAKDIEGARVAVTREDFNLIENGPWDWGENYINNKDIDFPKPDYPWGTIYGVRISDMNGKQICKTKFPAYQHVRSEDRVRFAPGDLMLSLPE